MGADTDAIEQQLARRDWGDAALLTAFLWSVLVILYLPVLLARHPGEAVSGAMIEGATVLVAMGFGMAIFAIDRATGRWRARGRIALMLAAIVAISAVQVVIDYGSTYWVAVLFKPHWSRALPDLARSYVPFFTYACLFGFNLALFKLVFLRRHAAVERGRLADARLAARRSELAALRFQLNPHFLFNSLNAISALIVTGRSGAAEEMTGRLSAFLRASLASDPLALVPLAEELAMLDDYLEIESVRFGDRLAIAFDVAPAAEAARVPSFLLQPLVENAIKYGVAPAASMVEVCIRAEVADGMVRLAIANPVPAATPAAAGGAGVGLANVRDRLRAAFGEAAGLTHAARDGRFEVVLSFPLSGGTG